MPKSKAHVEYNNFVGGLITEATDINFPENASLDELNFEYLRNGSRRRRLGLDYDDVTQNISMLDTNTGKHIQTYYWEGAGQFASADVLVVQMGKYIYFFSANETDTIGSRLDVYSVDDVLLDYWLLDIDGPVDFASINGDLVAVTRENVNNNIYVIEYGNEITITREEYYKLYTRDFWGVTAYDGDTNLNLSNNINKRPISAAGTHIYNLRNQGWGVPKRPDGGGSNDPIVKFLASIGKYPSNADVLQRGMLADPSGDTSYDLFFPEELTLNQDISGRAPNGSFIIDAMNRGASRQSEADKLLETYSNLSLKVTGLLPEKTLEGPRIVSAFGGRALFAGFGDTFAGDENSPNLGSYIFYSQLVKNRADIFNCFQEADPTSSEISDIVDSDGGFINIEGMKDPIAIVPLLNSAVIFAKNGVWNLFGELLGGGFSATTQQIEKLTDVGCISKSSIVVAEDSIFFWSTAGVYVVSVGETGTAAARNITDTTIQTLVNDIPNIVKENMQGTFDASERRVKWLYTIEDDYSDSSNQFQFNRELVLDVVLNAWSANKFGELDATTGPFVSGYVDTPAFNSVETDVAVTVGGVAVTAVIQPEAFYKFETKSGDVCVDETGNHNGAISDGSQITIGAGKDGNVYNFVLADPLTGAVEVDIGSIDGNEIGTLSTWISLDSAAGAMRTPLISYGSTCGCIGYGNLYNLPLDSTIRSVTVSNYTPTHTYATFVAAGGAGGYPATYAGYSNWVRNVDMQNGAISFLDTTASPLASGWYHIALQWDSANAYYAIWLDGVKQTTSKFSGGTHCPKITLSNTLLCDWQSNYELDFARLLDGLGTAGSSYDHTRIYTEVLTDADIVNLAAEFDGGGFTAPTTPVTVKRNVRTATQSETKYLITTDSIFSFGKLSNNSWIDWYSVDLTGVDAAAYLWTGYITGGDTARNKQSPYVTMHMEKTTGDSSCKVSARWDWTTATASGKWTTPRQAYRIRRDSQDVVSSKMLTRGNGRALSLYMASEPAKDCRILGWAIELEGNTDV